MEYSAIVSDDSLALGFSVSTSSIMLLFCNGLTHHIFVRQVLGVFYLLLRSCVKLSASFGFDSRSSGILS